MSVQKTRLTFKTVNVGCLIEYENNPRENSGAVASVSNSIEDFGFKRPIVVDENLVILAGHTRLAALRKHGVENVTVAMVEGLTEEQKAAYRIMDNRSGELTLFDFDKVASEIASFGENAPDMTRYGFEPPKVEPPTPDDAAILSSEDENGKKRVICPRCGKVVE